MKSTKMLDAITGEPSADMFIKSLVQKTGVSRRFIEAARPMIEKAFSEVSEEYRVKCLQDVETIVSRQAETERCARQALADTKKFGQYSVNNDSAQDLISVGHFGFAQKNIKA